MSQSQEQVSTSDIHDNIENIFIIGPDTFLIRTIDENRHLIFEKDHTGNIFQLTSPKADGFSYERIPIEERPDAKSILEAFEKTKTEKPIPESHMRAKMEVERMMQVQKEFDLKHNQVEPIVHLESPSSPDESAMMTESDISEQKDSLPDESTKMTEPITTEPRKEDTEMEGNLIIKENCCGEKKDEKKEETDDDESPLSPEEVAAAAARIRYDNFHQTLNEMTRSYFYGKTVMV